MVSAEDISKIAQGLIAVFGVGGLGTLGFRLYAKQAGAALRIAEDTMTSLQARVTQLEQDAEGARQAAATARQAAEEARLLADEMRRHAVSIDRKYLSLLRWALEVVRGHALARAGESLEAVRHLPDLPDEVRRDLDDLT